MSNLTTAEAQQVGDDPNSGFGSKGYRTYVMGSLLLVYVFNFIDRSIINILTEPIKESFDVEDWQMGLLGGPMFAVLYTFLGIPLARVAERFNRVWIIALSVALWSLMTALCGLAPTFLMMMIYRIGVGIGEAGCTPPAQSLIADYYKPSSRATAVSVYALGVPFGGMLAALFGGTIAEQFDGPKIEAALIGWGMTDLANAYDWQNFEGWRAAFVLVGLPGLLVALLVRLTVKEPPRGYTDPPNLQKLEPVSFGAALKLLGTKATYWHVVFGATIASFIGYGVAQFSTSFFVRTHDLSLQTAALLFGIVVGLMASIGVFSSGFLADRMSKRHPRALAWLPALGMTASVPLYALGFLADNVYLALPPLMGAAVLHYFYLGPLYAVAGGVVDSRTRATSVAIALFIVNLLGYGLGPLLIGILSTALKGMFLSGFDLGLTLEICKATDDLSEAQQAACSSADARGLQWSLIIFCCGYAWASLHYLIAGRTLVRDMITTTSQQSKEPHETAEA